MYNEHFGLSQAPFRITPDTRLFYTGGGRGDVLDALVYAITTGEGIVKVVGEVGTGKTMLCRMLEERLPDNVQIAYLANPSLTPEDILHAVALELGLQVPVDAPRLQVMHALQRELLDRHAQNRRVVALVEEAQSMPVDTLEEIRLLSNLETKNEKLLQIILFGQPELDETLARPDIRQLRERITHSFQLKPLGADEIRDYVAFRLRASGYRGRDAFSSNAYRRMSRASEGLTRRVNIIADKAMLAAYAEDTHDVSSRHVKVAIRDSEFDAGPRRGAPRRPAMMAATLAAAAVALLAGGAGWYLGSHSDPSPQGAAISGPVPEPSAPVDPDGGESVAVGTVAVPAGPEIAAVQAPAAPQSATREVTVASAVPEGASGTGASGPGALPPAPPPAVEPAAAVGAPVAAAPRTGVSGDAPAGSAGKSSGAPEKADVPAPPPVPAGVAGASRTAPVADISSTTAPPAATPSPAVTPDEANPPAVAPPAVVPPAAVVAAAVPEPAPREPARSAARPESEVSLLERTMERTRTWLAQADGGHYTIQLLATDARQRRNLERFLRERQDAGDIDRVFVYETLISRRPWFGVLYGEFSSFSDARSTLRGLPGELRRHDPFIRNIRDIGGSS